MASLRVALESAQVPGTRELQVTFLVLRAFSPCSCLSPVEMHASVETLQSDRPECKSWSPRLLPGPLWLAALFSCLSSPVRRVWWCFLCRFLIRRDSTAYIPLRKCLSLSRPVNGSSQGFSRWEFKIFSLGPWTFDPGRALTTINRTFEPKETSRPWSRSSLGQASS